MRPLKTATAAVCLLLFSTQASAWEKEFLLALKNGGALVENGSGQVLFSHRSEEGFLPASILKIATAACALKQLGPDFRFMTDFYFTRDKQLVVKGYGDPNLVSEEIALIARRLAERGVDEIRGFVLDTSYFDPAIEIDGVSRSTNPYDAVNGALIANFNTVYVDKKGKQVSSAELQTPLTPIALETARGLPAGRQRVNLGKVPEKGGRYFAELLADFLRRNGVAVSLEAGVTFDTVPPDAIPFYRHRTSKTLTETIQSLLDYSTNFTANQVFLVMGAERLGAPATVEKGRRVLTDFLANQVGWKGFKVMEGSGLSRQNRVSPRQMMALLRYFEPHRDLLPLESGIFRAKTGTLHDANTLAGYFTTNEGLPVRFVIMVNDIVPYEYKFKLAKMLYSGLTER